MAAKIILKAFLKALGSKSTKPKVDVFKLSSEIKKAADKKKAAAAKVAKPKPIEDKLVVREHEPKGPKTAPKQTTPTSPKLVAPMLALPAPAAAPPPEPPKPDPKTLRHPEHDIGVGMLKSLGFKHEVANKSITKATQAIGADRPLSDVVKQALKSHAST